MIYELAFEGRLDDPSVKNQRAIARVYHSEELQTPGQTYQIYVVGNRSDISGLAKKIIKAKGPFNTSSQVTTIPAPRITLGEFNHHASLQELITFQQALKSASKELYPTHLT